MVSDRVLTVPNVVTIIRLLALPFVIVDLASGRLARGMLLLGVIGATDWLDGYLARRLGQVSRLGIVLDPVADRLVLLGAGIGIVVAEVAPLWVVVLVVGRDVLLTAIGGVLLARGAARPEVTWWGKTATFGLLWGFPILLLAAVLGDGPTAPQPAIQAVGWAVLIASTVLYWLTGIDYVRRMLRAGPAPGAVG